MITRNDVIGKAADECMKELYSFVQPSVTWEDFLEENRIYRKREEEWNNLPKENKPKMVDYCGPLPCDFYYLPKETLENTVDSYKYAYKLNGRQELLDTIEILKKYCKDPIVVDYSKEEDGVERKGYKRTDNLETVLNTFIKPFLKESKHIDNLYDMVDEINISAELQRKFFNFLDMAGNFFKWDSDLNKFYGAIYLGACPSSNKETVIENWKKYRNTDIEIDESKYKEDNDWNE